ncbi:MAG: DNA polymerase III subunit alpha [Deltaproteobacteria bacterium]|nr:DNA polymerase III subunit alpha [Deltaproteobacteria bacterium]
MNYAELSCKTAFSFLSAASMPEDLVDKAIELGLSALAITDEAGLYGVPRFCKAAKEAGLKAIVGARLGVKAPLLGNNEIFINLLVENKTGYRNLCRLITNAKLLRGRHEKTVTLDELEEHASGLFCLAGPELAPGLEQDNLGVVMSLFQKDHLFVEVQRHLVREEEKKLKRLVAAAKKLELPLVADNGVLYATAGDAPLLDVLTCMKHRVDLDSAGRLLKPNREWRLKSAREMNTLFQDLLGAINTGLELSRQCNFDISDLNYRFPDFPTRGGKSDAEMLSELVYSGARERYGHLSPRVKRQLEKELYLITKLGFTGYFLIVWDIVRFCMEQGIMVQGRGSAANSAVCYCLKITAVDPIGYDLLFERFLSEARGEWPDIDLDLPSGEKRERVIQYVYSRYGDKGAALTGSFIIFRGRLAARELAKVMGFTEQQADKLAGGASPWPGSKSRSESKPGEWLEDAGLDPGSRKSRIFLSLWQQLQGLPRHTSQHPGGMVIAAGRLDDVVPLGPTAMQGRRVIQWDKDDCADLGILKIDLLGLGMLDVLERSISLVKKHEGVDVDFAKLPKRDKQVFDMLKAADTVGVFQVESRAQMATLPRMKPDRFYDLVVEVALIRPGPIVGKMVHPYLNRRAGLEPVRYAHPCLKPILERTLGVPLFQEQVMRIAMEAAGFSAGEAEKLRRAMGFKRPGNRMKRLEEKLRAGLSKKGFSNKAVKEVAESLRSFSEYGFPESHAASFALITYASAYMKVHHPECYLAAMLNAYPMGFYPPAVLLKDAQRHGVQVLPMDVNRSGWECRPEHLPNTRKGLGVRLGFRFISGMRMNTIATLEAEQARRLFHDVSDLTSRCGFNTAELSSLAEIGAMASLGLGRRQALWQVYKVGRFGPGSLPGLARCTEIEENAFPLREMNKQEEISADLKLSGMTTGAHPVSFFRTALTGLGVIRAKDMAIRSDGEQVKAAGLVIARQRPHTAKGVLFITIEDETGFANLIVKPDVLERNRKTITRAGFMLASGILEKRSGVLQVLVKEIEDLAEKNMNVRTRAKSHDFR